MENYGYTPNERFGEAYVVTKSSTDDPVEEKKPGTAKKKLDLR